MRNKHQFITFEGVEGSGKSTQAKLLAEFFQKNNQPTILTREPGGSKAAEEIRSILINGDVDKIDGVTETLLNFAARRDHIEKLIKPAINNSKIVVSDRFYDSTFAYQGYGYGLDLNLIENIKKCAIGSFKPDVTFLIDIDIDLMQERIKGRDDNNRYENMKLDFHSKVKKGFLKIAQENQERIIVIDGVGSVEEVHQKILQKLK